MSVIGVFQYKEQVQYLYQKNGQKFIDEIGNMRINEHSALQSDKEYTEVLGTENIEKICSFIENYCLNFSVAYKRIKYNNETSTIVIKLQFAKIHIFLNKKNGHLNCEENFCFDSIYFSFPENYLFLCSLIQNAKTKEKEIQSKLLLIKKDAEKMAKSREIQLKTIVSLIRSVLSTPEYSWELEVRRDSIHRLLVQTEVGKVSIFNINENDYIQQILELPKMLKGGN